MGGMMSRRKGLIHEYAVRDALRAEGYEADRVPSSGAAEGFKGDIRFRKDGREYLAEVKARRKEFHRIYALVDRYATNGCLSLACGEAGVCISIAPTAAEAFACATFTPSRRYEQTPVDSKGVRKLLNVRQFVKGCDILVLHDDRRSYLYVVYK